jgi:ATP-dependent Clp protease adaptor protein ClpS
MEDSMAADIEVKQDEQIKQKVSEPKKWKVIFLNDDQTPMEFVVTVLNEIFKHNLETATQITMQVHEQGSGIAGVYTFEIAEVKSMETVQLARSNGFPLQVKLEEE